MTGEVRDAKHGPSRLEQMTGAQPYMTIKGKCPERTSG
jgi:hypothetical protein